MSDSVCSMSGVLLLGVGGALVAEMLRPDALLARREDPVGIQRVLDGLVEPPLGVVAEGVLLRREVHEVQVRAVLAVALLRRGQDGPPAGGVRLLGLLDT